MEANSWRPSPPDSAVVDAADWRNQLQPEARQRIVTKIMDTLKKHLPISAPEGLSQLRNIAVRFEEKIYVAATSQADYLRKISLKMLSMETKTQQTASINPSMSNGAGPIQNPSDPASLAMQAQVNNQGQSLPVSMVNQSAARQQILPQNIQNANLTSVQSSTNIASGLSSIPGSGQSPLSGVGMAGIGQNSATSSLAQSVAPDIYSNTQRQMQGRQQQIVSQQQQSQNQQLYQQQLHRQLMKQKLQPSLLQPHMQQQQQQQQQQQTLLQATQLQSSQQPLMQMSSSLQSGQTTIQQTQPGLQQSPQTGIQQSQLTSTQQSMAPLLQQHTQSLSRQQQLQTSMHQQTPTLNQQPASVPQQNTLPLQQHSHQITGSQTNISSIQQSQLLGQQPGVSDMQQAQRVPVQQNNLLGMQQPQQMLNQQVMSLHQQQPAGPQSSMSGLQQQQQQQQRSMHMHPHSKGAITQQQQNQQASMALLQQQGHHTQPQSSQQQLASQFQTQPAQVQQHLSMEHNSNSLQLEMQQRLQPGALLSQNASEQQKQNVQSQRGLPDVSSSTSVDSTGQTGHVDTNDWQEEIHQKIKSMKELYFSDLNELYQKIAFKLQQTDGLIPPAKQSDQYDKMKSYKSVLERMLNILQLPKANLQIGFRDKLPLYEKQMISIIASFKKKPMQTPAQQQFQHSSQHAQPMPQQQSSQMNQLQQHDNHTNLEQQMNFQGSATSMQSAAPVPAQGNSFSSRQQRSIGVIQGAAVSGQGNMNIPQQTNSNTPTHSSINTLQSVVTSMQPTPIALQQQHLKQQQQQEQQPRQHLIQAQQLKQHIQQRHLKQQMLQQKQQVLQTQQPLQQFQQQKQQQATQVPAQPQLCQTNEASDVKPRQDSGVKPRLYQQQYSGGQRNNCYQQLKSGVTFPISSPQDLQALSPQIPHQSSPQIDQQNLLPSQIKAETPMQSANSSFVPSPTASLTPSSIPGEMEKSLSGVSALKNSGHVGHQKTGLAATQPQSLPVSILGMSASPLLAEFNSPDGHLANGNSAATGKTSVAESPIGRLIKAMRKSSAKVLTSAVNDIASVVSMTDRIAGSAPGNGSRAAVGEDLVVMTKSRLQARNFVSQDGNSTAKKMKRDTSAMPLDKVSSIGNDYFINSHGGLDTSELESTATSHICRRTVEINHNILEEIKEINQQLIDTEVKISEEDADSAASASEGDGVVIKCSYLGVALSPSLKSYIASAPMSPFPPLRLLVPASYPKCSPVLLDKLPDKESMGSDDLSIKAKSRLSVSLRGLSQPMSLREMAKSWDACTRKVITEYAEQFGGGTFSSRYGTWESCVGA